MEVNLSSPGHHPLDVLSFVAAEQAAGTDIALIVITSVTGGAMRAGGALMAVTKDGRSCGYVSNGCVDSDIVAQAQAAISSGDFLQLRYGEGSPFRDIELPCGGRIDLLVLPHPSPNAIQQTRDTLADRNSATFTIDSNGRISNKNKSLFSITYPPKLKLRIVGTGDALAELVSQSTNMGFEIKVQTPDVEIIKTLAQHDPFHLTSAKDLPELTDDPHTAVVLLFHDHAWEAEILRQALNGPAFYIGAMGSPKTHKARRDMLTSVGVSQSDIERIRGPIGLIPSSRSANILALSTLAEIIQTAQQQNLL